MTETHNEISLPLGESYATPQRATFESWFLFFEFLAALASLFCTPFLTLGALDTIFGFLFVGIGAIPLSIILAAICRYATSSREEEGAVSFDGKYVTVYDQSDGTYIQHSARLIDCQWFFGLNTWATAPNHNAHSFFFVPKKTLLLKFPPWCRTLPFGQGKYRVPEGEVIVSVGTTPEKREQWKKIFEKFHVPHDEKREKIRPLLPFSLQVVGAMTWLAVSFFVTMKLAGVLLLIFVSCGIAKDIAYGLSFPFFVPGVFFVALIVPLIYGYHRAFQLDMDGAKIEPKVWWVISATFWSLVIYLGVTLWFFFEDERWPLLAKIAAEIVMILQALAVTYFVRKSCQKIEKLQNSREEITPPQDAVVSATVFPPEVREKLFAKLVETAPTWCRPNFPFMRLNFVRSVVLLVFFPFASMFLCAAVDEAYQFLLSRLQMQVPKDIEQGIALGLSVPGFMITAWFLVAFFNYRDWKKEQTPSSDDTASPIETFPEQEEEWIESLRRKLSGTLSISLAVFILACWSAPYDQDWTARTVVVVFGVTILLGLASRAASIPSFSALFSTQKEGKDDFDEFGFRNLRKYQ